MLIALSNHLRVEIGRAPSNMVNGRCCWVSDLQGRLLAYAHGAETEQDAVHMALESIDDRAAAYDVAELLPVAIGGEYQLSPC